ncbi:UNVERIFIED_CONTAM: hypothetical protein Sradi_2425900 [Sesamum radiatum]|uniref:Uncharacterized protein n=1 Tax=Sesamum radiatum TaxID=300843 RepID=A0AAW2SHL2_SESRA
METVRTIFTHTYPYPHEHSRHAVIAVFRLRIFISSDNMHTLVLKLDSNVKWWSMYVAWILVAALYHLPSFQSMGVDMRMNLSLFLTIFVSSVLFSSCFPFCSLALVISIACCVFYSHCGNLAIIREKTLEKRHWSWFPRWNKDENFSWLAKFVRVYEFKDQVCKSWFAPVGSASDYPFLSKWVIYGELTCSGGSCAESPDEISPIYSLWATFIGLYIANYVVERSTGWALTHPVSQNESEKLKKKQMKPDFLDMVPWYSGTSADLFKTVFDLMVSVTLFVGRFDMRMMQAAMSRVEDGAKQDDLLYDQFSEHDELWFDFMADTGDGGNSSYSVARLLAQPLLRNKDSLITLPRANLLLIGGDLA